MRIIYLMMVWLFLSLNLTGWAAAQDEKAKDKEYYDSGALHFEYSRLNNRLHGTTKEYYETGELKAEMIYKEGKLESKKEFLRNGRLKYELRITGGKRYETEIEYYRTGELFRERHLVNGVREGLEIEYYKNGKKKAERRYEAGKKEGNSKGYHSNGNLQGDWEFENGVPVKATIYYRSGEKWLEHVAFDERGNLNGVSYEYDKEGNLIARRYYDDNQMLRRERIQNWLDYLRFW